MRQRIYGFDLARDYVIFEMFSFWIVIFVSVKLKYNAALKLSALAAGLFYTLKTILSSAGSIKLDLGLRKGVSIAHTKVSAK